MEYWRLMACSCLEREPALLLGLDRIVLLCVLWLVLVQGSDHPETALAHAHLASFLSTCGVIEAAIRHIRRAIYVLELSCGPTHRETVGAYLKMALFYQVRVSPFVH